MNNDDLAMRADDVKAATVVKEDLERLGAKVIFLADVDEYRVHYTIRAFWEQPDMGEMRDVYWDVHVQPNTEKEPPKS